MDAVPGTDRIVDLEHKVDDLTEQVAFLVEEARAQRRRREALEELQRDLAPVLRSLMGDAAEELDRLDLRAEDVAGLLRRLARNVDTLERALAQMESLADLARELSRISRPAMDAAIDKLAEAEARGYFGFARAGLGVVDRIVTGFSEEDVAALGDNVVTILEVVKELTQPQMLAIMSRVLAAVERQHEEIAWEPEEPPSLWGILRQLRDPDVRRGLARALNTLRAAAEATPPEEIRQLTDDRTEGGS